MTLDQVLFWPLTRTLPRTKAILTFDLLRYRHTLHWHMNCSMGDQEASGVKLLEGEILMEKMSARTIYVILFVLTILMVVATRTLVTPV